MPCDPIQRFAWLFAQRPDLLTGGASDGTSHYEEIAKAQADAIRTVYDDDGGLAAVLRLAQFTQVPEVVGQVIALTGIAASEDEQERLLALLDAPEGADRRLAHGYAAKRFDLEGWHWAREMVEQKGPEWSPEKRAAFLRTLPFVPQTWDWAAHFGEDTERAYWSTVSMLWCSDPAGVERAARLLLRYERPAHAVNLLAMCLQGTTPQIDADLIVQALEQLVRQGSQSEWIGLAHEIGTLLDTLALSMMDNFSRLASLEWLFLPILRGLGHSTTVLNRQLAHDPEFFVDVLCTVFPAHDEEPHETTDEQQAMALLGYRLLDSWQRPPGYRDDGTFDEEAMNAWVNAARTLAAEHKREQIADQQIGHVLSHLPEGPDGLWPHPAARRLVERLASGDLETGMERGRRKNRGVTMRNPGDGGAQERALQTKYLIAAQQLTAEWPRTAAMLRRIARSYSEEARRQDEHAEITQERWR
jgi:predicted pyridoxine 5'-phosphate oxidase superfamily flavin-nucleotide-binding protein